jgi:hypothetical protein
LGDSKIEFFTSQNESRGNFREFFAVNRVVIPGESVTFLEGILFAPFLLTSKDKFILESAQQSTTQDAPTRRVPGCLRGDLRDVGFGCVRGRRACAP